MVSTYAAKKAIREWLDRCTCENGTHPVGDARTKKAYLFLHPAINEDLKADLPWLYETAARAKTEEELIKNLESMLIWKRREYNYLVRPPIICADCAKAAGLEIHDDWNVVSWPLLTCKDCGAQWDPWADQNPGAYNTLGTGAICVNCYLRGSADVEKNEEIRNELQRSATEAKGRKGRDQLRRDRNEEILREWLEKNTCVECGEEHTDELVAVAGPKSPPGKPYLWRRDDANEAFKNKIQTTIVYCKKHQPK